MFNKIIPAIILIVLCTATFSLAKTPIIAIEPFNIDAEGDLSFLQKGIQQMLLTRLSIPSVSSSIPGNDPNAQYTLSGNILIFGDHASTDAYLVDNQSGNRLLSFHKNSQTKDEVLSHINDLATIIKQNIFHINSMTPPQPALISAPSQPQAIPTLPTQPPLQQSQKIIKTRLMNKNIAAFCLGAIRGNTANELVLCTSDTISLMSPQDNSLKELDKISLHMNQKILSVDTADINGNGKSEIVVTIFNSKSLKPNSMILEWTGSKLAPIKTDINWLFRIVKKSTKPILVAQKILPNASNILAPGIYKILLNTSGQLTSEKLSLPRELTLYSFTMGDILNNGDADTIVSLSRNGNLSIYSSDGSLIWEGDDQFGGSKVFIEYKGDRYTRDDGFQLNRFFIQPKLRIADIDKDGRNSLYLLHNKDKTKGFLSSTKIFKSGRVVELAWDKLGLTPVKSTINISGYIADFEIKDYDADGTDELIFCVVRKKGILSTKFTSQIITMNALTQTHATNAF